MASSARIDELRKKFEENPRRYFAPLANEYRKAGDIDQAISICREYLPQQPGHMSGHIVYGQALYEARQYEEARTVFETALALDPENLIALRHLGDIALIVGDIDNARTWYGRVLEADPRNEEIQAQLKSLESVTPTAEPTPMSTPAVQTQTPAAQGSEPTPLSSPAVEPGVEAPVTAATSPEPVQLPTLELTLPAEGAQPARSPASSAPTVVVAAVPVPAVERTVELPATPPPEPVPSLSTTPTAEITLDQTPVPAVPDLENLDLPASTLPVEKAAGLETTAVPTPDAPPIDSFTLEGLETTSVAADAPAPPADAATVASPVETSPPSAPADVASESLRETTAPAPAEKESAPADTASADEPAPASSQPSTFTSDLPFLDVGESLPASMAESKPFVTETMAELYEQQGHRDEALRVYRALLEQRPNDEHILARIEKLEGKRGPTIRELLVRVAERRPAPPVPPSVPAVSPASDAAPKDAPLAATPSIDSTPPEAATASHTQPASPAASPGPVQSEVSQRRTDVLGQLFGSAAVTGADERAAITLSAAFSSDGRSNGSPQPLPGEAAHPAPRDLSLDSVFGTGASSPPPASSFSFDQFFSERATAEHPTPGTRAAGESRGQETKDDVAKFTQWLEGLKQR